MTFPIFDYLEQRARLAPDREAMREVLTDRAVTYGELDERAGRAAGLLATLGVGAGDRVAILCRNRIEFFELLFAVGRLGAILVPLNWRMPAVELRPLLDDSRPVLVLTGAEDLVTAETIVADELVINLDDPGVAGYGARRDAAERHPGRGPWEAGDCWYLLYTSGTTGLPKAVIQTVGMSLANYVNISGAMDLRPHDTTVNFLPLFHTAGINLTTLPVLIDGGRVLILPGFDADQIVALIEAAAIDTFFGVPACYQQISLHPRFEMLALGRVRSWGCGGAPLPDVLIDQFGRRGARVMNGMGMTETGPTVFLMDAAAVENKIGSVGKPQVLASVRLVGPDGRDVRRGEAGELWLSGPGITPGYYNRPDATGAALVDGWLRSGDLGRQDEDGYYYIVGRLKDMYISGGENVYPAEVENVLAGHPDVLEAAVVGVADDRWGEVGQAHLLARPGHTLPDAAALAGWCRERLAPYKVPKSFVTVEAFPRTAAGKIQKHLLEN
ncbi:MAG: long-chain fatty acid--CoA ligase [Pseudomonadota bacterium]